MLGSPNWSLVTLQHELSYMMNATPGWKDWLHSSLQAAQLSSRLPSFDMAGARDGFWGCHHHALVHLVPKLSHVGAVVDGLACHLHRPTTCGR
jgi:hypothetical protein